LKQKTLFKIRPVQKSDKGPLALVFQSCFSHEPFLEKWTLLTAQKRIAQILSDSQVTGWVATVFGYPVGFAFLQTRQGAQEIYGELLETAVHPYFQNQEIESGLLKSVQQFQKRKKIKNVMVLAFRGKHEKLFKNAGWAPSKRTVLYVSK
jgi:N-acetylglutamate synthase-like GNAT family acetyltransferase